MTTLSTAVGASLLAHGLHYAMVLVGLWGLGALLLPHVLDRGSSTMAWRPSTAHDARVAALRATVAAGGLGRPIEQPVVEEPLPERPEPASARGLPLALVGSATAAGIHAAVAPPHLRDSALFGFFFLAVALAQLAWTAALLQRPHADLLRVGVALNVALIGLWLVTRTVGLPFGLLPERHPVGGWDVACVVWEATVILCCVHALRREVPARLPGWFDWHPSSRAAVGAAAMSLVLLTLCGAHS
ncbi:hypothetical protein BH11ACT8_BH11ACT8_32170 [soil metagenome]